MDNDGLRNTNNRIGPFAGSVSQRKEMVRMCERNLAIGKVNELQLSHFTLRRFESNIQPGGSQLTQTHGDIHRIHNLWEPTLSSTFFHTDILCSCEKEPSAGLNESYSTSSRPMSGNNQATGPYVVSLVGSGNRMCHGNRHVSYESSHLCASGGSACPLSSHWPTPVGWSLKWMGSRFLHCELPAPRQ